MHSRGQLASSGNTGLEVKATQRVWQMVTPLTQAQ
jgi:hypothetical protein